MAHPSSFCLVAPFAAKDAGKCRTLVSSLRFDAEATLQPCEWLLGFPPGTRGTEINNKKKKTP